MDHSHMPPSLRPLLREVERLRSGVGTESLVAGAAEDLMVRAEEVSARLQELEPPGEDAPPDQRETWEESQERFQGGLQELHEGCGMILAWLEEREDELLREGQAKVVSGGDRIASVGLIWREFLERYGMG